jgi:hypothetical protein
METITFTNGRTANHVLVTDSGKVHHAADSRIRGLHIIACNGRAMSGAGWNADRLAPNANWCVSCRKLDRA